MIVRRALGHGLQDVPVLDDLAILQAEEISHRTASIFMTLRWRAPPGATVGSAPGRAPGRPLRVPLAGRCEGLLESTSLAGCELRVPGFSEVQKRPMIGHW